jgi:death-on-curing protein
MIEYLELADALIIAGAVLDEKPEVLALGERIGLLDSALHAPRAGFDGFEFYPDLAVKAAVLCAHIAKNHGLPDGNKRVAFLAMVEFLERNGHEWIPPIDDGDGEITDAVIRGVAASDLGDDVIAGLTAWIRGCAGL